MRLGVETQNVAYDNCLWLYDVMVVQPLKDYV